MMHTGATTFTGGTGMAIEGSTIGSTAVTACMGPFGVKVIFSLRAPFVGPAYFGELKADLDKMH
jgi:hypothetical protein